MNYKKEAVSVELVDGTEINNMFMLELKSGYIILSDHKNPFGLFNRIFNRKKNYDNSAVLIPMSRVKDIYL